MEVILIGLMAWAAIFAGAVDPTVRETTREDTIRFEIRANEIHMEEIKRQMEILEASHGKESSTSKDGR